MKDYLFYFLVFFKNEKIFSLPTNVRTARTETYQFCAGQNVPPAAAAATASAAAAAAATAAATGTSSEKAGRPAGAVDLLDSAAAALRTKTARGPCLGIESAGVCTPQGLAPAFHSQIQSQTKIKIPCKNWHF